MPEELSKKLPKLSRDERLSDTYMKYYEYYLNKYGGNTVLLMQVGSFFELYGVDNKEEKVGNIAEITSLLNIILTRKDKEIIENSRGNPMMAGFPLNSMNRFVRILLEDNYTVVIIEQTSPPPNVNREVTQILSPGTYIEESLDPFSSYFVSLYLENETIGKVKRDKCEISVGMSVIDYTTGKCVVHESYSNNANVSVDIRIPYNEIYRFIRSYNPREILVYAVGFPDNFDEEYLTKELELGMYNTHFHIGKIEGPYKKLSWQNEFLKGLFPKDTMMSPIEYLDLEYLPYALLSYILLLRYTHELNDVIVKNLEKPILWTSQSHLILTHNAASQLNLVAQGREKKYNSVYSVINNASTAIGKRRLKDQLLNPILNIDELNKRYDLIEEILNNKDSIEHIESLLKQVLDIERLQRKMGLGQLHPSEFNSLNNTYENVTQLLLYIQDNPEFNKLKEILPEKDMIQEFNDFQNYYKEYFDLDCMSKYNLKQIEESFFLKGVNKEIDKVQCNISEAVSELEDIATLLSNIIKKLGGGKIGGKELVKVTNTEKEGHYLSVSAKNGGLLKNYKESKLLPEENTFMKTIEFQTLKSVVKLRSKDINSHSRTINSNKSKIRTVVQDEYITMITGFAVNNKQLFGALVEFVAILDMMKSLSKSALKNRYCKPEIRSVMDDTAASFLLCKGIRHPLSEKIQQDIMYVKNDISIGQIYSGDNSDVNVNGMLLFGVNYAGKSTLMKAVGVNIILAQIGSYVAADSFVYRPFSNIITRISSEDNILKNQSTFTIEMAELRTILRHSNENTLVLGDELCHGTETVSAQGIVAATIIKLAHMNTNFIFATHLHDIPRMERIKKLENVKFFHLKVTYNEKEDELVYDRKLSPGSGPSIYGLEVAKSLDLGQDFITLADSIRREMSDVDEELMVTKTSKYNSNVIMKICTLCGNKCEHVHHIKEQHTADENGYIEHFHKNAKHNLVPICESCHLKCHGKNGELLKLDGYKQTSSGVKLKILD